MLFDIQLIELGVRGALHSTVGLQSKQRHGVRLICPVRNVMTFR